MVSNKEIYIWLKQRRSHTQEATQLPAFKSQLSKYKLIGTLYIVISYAQ